MTVSISINEHRHLQWWTLLVLILYLCRVASGRDSLVAITGYGIIDVTTTTANKLYTFAYSIRCKSTQPCTHRTVATFTSYTTLVTQSVKGLFSWYQVPHRPWCTVRRVCGGERALNQILYVQINVRFCHPCFFTRVAVPTTFRKMRDGLKELKNSRYFAKSYLYVLF